MNYLNMGFFDNYPNAYYYPSNAYQFPHPGMLNYNIPYFQQQQFLPQEQPKDLQSNLKQYVNLRIYAQPLFEDFTPLNKNDIIFIDQDYIKVEKSIISN